MKSNYQIIIEYDGTNYNGWQFQKNGSSIQNEIEKALRKLLKRKIRVIGSGRTDAGVHAVCQSANFFCDKIENNKKFLNSLNYFLSKKNISISSIKKKNLNFHSRFDAKKRTYKYIIVNRKNFLVLDKNRAWLVKKKLNINDMKKAIKLFSGTHNFNAFRSSSCSAKSPVRTIEKSSLIKKDGKIIIFFHLSHSYNTK